MYVGGHVRFVIKLKVSKSQKLNFCTQIPNYVYL